MPFVVDWTPVSALGSLAMSAGAAQGTTIGNQDFIRRQSAADAQAAEFNQRNRELSYAATQAPAQQKLQANLAEQASQNQFDRQLTLQDRGLERDFLRQKALADMQEARDQRITDRQAALVNQRQEADYQYDTMRREQLKKDFYESRARAGIPPDQIDSEWSQAELFNVAPQYAKQQAAGTKPGITGTPKGEFEMAGFRAAQMGNASQFTPQAIDQISIFKQSTPLYVSSQLYNGAVMFYANDAYCTLQQAQAAAVDPAKPEWERQAAKMAIVQRGDVKYGANQAPAAQSGQPANVRGASDQDLFNAVSRWSNKE